MGVAVSKHFALAEFLPPGLSEQEVPGEVVSNITKLAVEIMDPVRDHFRVPIHIHSGYRPPEINAAVGGVPTSDHARGAADDFHVADSEQDTWDANTIAAFEWIRTSGLPFGQLILEDHRAHYRIEGKLWVHVSLPSAKHDGSKKDRNRVLVSYAPREYAAWKAPRLA
jgi:putative chitinase